jgi:hypothetical protein
MMDGNQHDQGPKPPHGLLFLLDPQYADLLPAQERFEQALEAAGDRLWLPEQFLLQ